MSYGYTKLVMTSQDGVPTDPAIYYEYGACVAQASFFDLDGNAYTPAGIAYSLVDVYSGTIIQNFTNLTDGPTAEIVIAAAQNGLISLTLRRERRNLILRITDDQGQYTALARYDLLRLTGAPTPPDETTIDSSETIDSSQPIT